ncbi:MAG: bifunctional hydroxymethylpyrimidine kinase/phosphomethylpyrimidine kinase [Candidatus Hydrogenedens sp.]|nr:bifunctional hydroxymethylpyrimidine kinase/phosphomethylpyrimidine kinase [Candidatus Hydrogenedens sp.]
MIPRVLSIAGSDSGGGAGIQADLKTMCALGCYGMTAVTAVTYQNTQDVAGVTPVAPEHVAKQIDLVLEDIGADAIKIGMLGSAAVVEAVAAALDRHAGPPIVLDPVMVSKSGARLLDADAGEALLHWLLPQAAVITPNAREAEALTGIAVQDEDSLLRAADALLKAGARAVLAKGGHLEGAEAVDWLITPDLRERYSRPRIDTKNTHGTGCTYSSAVACFLAQGIELPQAVAFAKDYLHHAILHALPLGQGHGPLHHAWATEFLDAE